MKGEMDRLEVDVELQFNSKRVGPFLVRIFTVSTKTRRKD